MARTLTHRKIVQYAKHYTAAKFDEFIEDFYDEVVYPDGIPDTGEFDNYSAYDEDYIANVLRPAFDEAHRPERKKEG